MADDARTEKTEPKLTTGGRRMTWLWMILSLVVVGGFLFWLGMASEPTAVAVVEDPEAATEEMPVDSGVVAVPKDTLAANKAEYEGELIQVSRVEATTELGPRIFWGELGDRTRQVPILVRLDSAAAQDWQMTQGALYTITGELRQMSDSLATAWGEGGEFLGEGEQMQAAFTDYFIQASRVRTSRGGGSGQAPGGGAGAAGGEG